MSTKRLKATFATSLSSGAGAGTSTEEKLLNAVLGEGSEREMVIEGGGEANLMDQFDPDFAVLEEIMDRDAEALRALAK